MYRFDESFPLPLEYDECEILLEEVSSLMNDGRIPGYLKTLSFPFSPFYPSLQNPQRPRALKQLCLAPLPSTNGLRLAKPMSNLDKWTSPANAASCVCVLKGGKKKGQNS